MAQSFCCDRAAIANLRYLLKAFVYLCEIENELAFFSNVYYYSFMNLFTERCELTFLTLIISFLFMLPAAADEPLISVETFDFGNTINDLCLSGNAIICATENGLYRWDRDSMEYSRYTILDAQNFDAHHAFTHVAADTEGRIMAAYSSIDYIAFFDGENWENYTAGLFNRPHQALFADSSDRFWGGTINSALYSWDGAASTEYPAGDALFDINDIVTEDNGAVWLATKDGVVCIDGERMPCYFDSDGLPDNNTSCIFNHDGVIWAGTRKGVARIENEAVTPYFFKGGVSMNIINDILVDDSGTVWAASNGGVARYDGVSWEYFTEKNELMDNRVTSMALDSDNRVWFCTSYDDKGITVYENGEFVWYTRFDGSIPVHGIQVVANDSENNVWIGWDGGAACRKNGEWVSYGLADGLAGETVSDIWPAENGGIWVKFKDSASVGLSRFSDGQWQTFSSDSDIDWNKTDCLLELADNSLLVGVERQIFRVDNGNVEEIAIYGQLLSSTIYDIDESPDTSLWLGSALGLVRFSDGTFTHWTEVDGLPENHIDYVEVAADNSVWCLSGGKTLIHFDGETFTSVSGPDGSEPALFSSIEVDNSGILWAVKGYDRRNFYQNQVPVFDFLPEEAGLYSYDGVAWTFHPFPDDSSYRHIGLKKVLADENGVIWCATDAGLARYENGTWSLHATNGPINRNVTDIKVDNNNIKWFATSCGISSYDGMEWTHYPLRYSGTPGHSILCSIEKIIVDHRTNLKWFYTRTPDVVLISFDGEDFVWHEMENPLIHDYFMVIDHDGVLWFDTVHEIACYDGKTYREYDTVDELLSSTRHYIHVDRNNVKWFIGETGAVSYDGKTFTSYPCEDFRLPYSFDSVLTDRNGTMWLLSGSVLYSFDGETWTYHSDDPNCKALNSIALFPDGSLWNAGMYGLHKFDGETWVDVPDSPLDGHDIPTLLYADKCGRVWVRTDLYTWYIYNGVEWVKEKTEQQLFVFYNQWIEEMDGSIWILDSSELMRFSTNVQNKAFTAPNILRLRGNSPNPFNAGTMIEFDLENMSTVTLSIYNMLGQKVYESAPTLKPVGRNAILWNGRNNDGGKVSSGAYFYRVKAGGKSADGRMMFVK